MTTDAASSEVAALYRAAHYGEDMGKEFERAVRAVIEALVERAEAAEQDAARLQAQLDRMYAIFDDVNFKKLAAALNVPLAAHEQQGGAA